MIENDLRFFQNEEQQKRIFNLGYNQNTLIALMTVTTKTVTVTGLGRYQWTEIPRGPKANMGPTDDLQRTTPRRGRGQRVGTLE